MRVAVDAGVLNASWGGIPKYVHRIAGDLLEAGDEVHLLVKGRGIGHPVDGAKLVEIPIRGTSVWREACVPAWLALHRPDVFWAPEGTLPRVLPVPAVATIHDLAMFKFPGSKPADSTERFRGAVQRAVRQAKRVVTVSQATADDVAALFGAPPEILRVIPNGIDDRFVPGDRAAAAAAVAERFGLDGPFVLHVGSLEPRKGLDVLIDAASLAAAAGAPWRVAIAGNPAFDGERIAAAARASAGCELLGPVDDDELLDLYRAAEILAAPALDEGFGITPLEAMACGTPAVIAANSGGLVEISGPAAVLVEERTPEAWRGALESAMAERESLVARSIEHAKPFTWKKTSAMTRDVLLEAAAKKSA